MLYDPGVSQGEPVELDRPSEPPVSGAIDRAEVVVVAGDGQSDDPADRWLIRLRWGAIAGMAITIVVAHRWVDGLRIEALFAVLLAIAASNLGWMTLVYRSLPISPRRYVEAQLVADVLCLALVLWFAGGISNPFAAFMVLQIALGGLLCTPRATIGIAAVTIVLVGALAFAEPLPRLSSRLEIAAAVVSLSSLAGLIAAFVAIYARRLDVLRQESARNEKLAVLGRLVGAMSHELNTPLATIQLLSKDLERFGGDMSTGEAHEIVRGVVEQAERANSVIGLVRGHVGPDQMVERVELSSFVETFAREELERLAFKGAVAFELEPPIDAPVMRRALVQVLANVLRNAAEASILRRNPRIVVAVKRVDGHAEVSVTDHGPGFRPEVLARLGEPFQTTKSREGGMGLGLYVSARLARQMGSTLKVQSVPRGGARVSLTVDLAEGGEATDGLARSELSI